MKINRNNFDFLDKTEDTITVLVTFDPDEITEFEADINDPTFVSFKVGDFLKKEDRTGVFKHLKGQVWMATYKRHPEQKFTPLKAMDIAAAEHYNRISGKKVRLRKLPKTKRNA